MTRSRPGWKVCLVQRRERKPQPVLLLPHHASPPGLWLQPSGDRALEGEELPVYPVIEKWRVDLDQPEPQVVLPHFQGCRPQERVQRAKEFRLTHCDHVDSGRAHVLKVATPIDGRRQLAQVSATHPARLVALLEPC